MVRKTVFTRAEIIRAAIEVVQAQGSAALSARQVAQALGSSTAPVYSNFNTMAELGRAVRREVADDLVAFTTHEYVPDSFLNIGRGVLEYARQNPTLYAAIFMNGGSQCPAGSRVMATLGDRMAEMPELAELPQAERLLLLHQMATFTHGLAVQVCTGLADHFTFDDLILLLEDAGAGMTQYALSRPVRSQAHEELMESLMAFSAKEAEDNE